MEPEDIAFLVMMIAFVFFICVVISTVTKGEVDPFKALRKGKCPPHKWAHQPDGKIYCENCPFKPSDNSRT